VLSGSVPQGGKEAEVEGYKRQFMQKETSETSCASTHPQFKTDYKTTITGRRISPCKGFTLN